MGRSLDVFEIDTCAAAAHEVNRIYSGSLGETLEVHWEDLPAERQQVARFEELPLEIQYKDTLWVNTVKMMIDSFWRKTQ